MTRRPGVTMSEVLVTIFVVAIGLAGVMSMFPFAARQMSDALVSDRATSLSQSTDGLVRGYWKEKVVENNGNGEPFFDALDNPATAGITHPSFSTLPGPRPGEPSYPVFLDPMGVFRGTTNGANWVGDTSTIVPRRSMKLVTASGNPSNAALRMFSQADGFSWDEDSKPLTNAAEMRELRYNALAVIQRPTNRDKFSATLKIVVFLNRKHQFYPAGSEAVFDATWTPGTTQIQLPAGDPPTGADIKKGSWIMDAGGEVLPATNPKTFIRHANFYRVVSATENTPGTYDVELHTPVKRVDGGTLPYTAKAVVMAGVAEVYERSPLNGNSQP